MNAHNITRQYLTTSEVGEILGVHRVTVRRWVGQGILKGKRVGPRNIRIHRAEVDRFAGVVA